MCHYLGGPPSPIHGYVARDRAILRCRVPDIYWRTIISSEDMNRFEYH